jgi:thioredoxin reductase/Pyruvate/2-oxoacid:ferredoxin oxidoreductase delta subunit
VHTRRILAPLLAWTAGILLLAALWLHGGDYYRLGLTGDEARFDHPLHAALRASGSWGHLLGLLGGVLILANLAYLLRRHVPALRRAGSLRGWMAMHVATGLLGTSILAFHSTFSASNAYHQAALGALLLLAFTGLAGRFLYAFVPHNARGEELSIDELVSRVIAAGERDPAAIAARVDRSNRLRGVLSGWRAIHRPLAMIMTTAACVHVVVASLVTWTEIDVYAEAGWYAVAGTTAVLGSSFLLLEVALVRRRRKRARHDLARRIQAELAGLHLPPSLHPVIDLDRCMGSAACIAACPEGTILGFVDGAARLLEGANCIGHGRCAAECPMSAITLVFGTAQRGVDIPNVSSDFESAVPGLYLTGEIGGMGLIRNAVIQSTQAVRHLAARRPRGEGDELDLVVVGAGPAGLTAALAARQAGLRCEVLDQETAGGAILHYPRHKVVMTMPFELPGHGKVTASTISKEELLELFDGACRRAGVSVHQGEGVQAVTRDGPGFVVRTTRRTLRARTVLLCIGRRGSPQTLGVPGEELPTVTYRLLDPAPFGGHHVLVVGGGDSAVEACLALADAGAHPTLSYRQQTLSRPKPANRERFAAAVEAGRVRFEGGTSVQRIERESVMLRRGDQLVQLPNDDTLVLAGGRLPTDFLTACGVTIERRFGERRAGA